MTRILLSRRSSNLIATCLKTRHNFYQQQCIANQPWRLITTRATQVPLLSSSSASFLTSPRAVRSSSSSSSSSSDNVAAPSSTSSDQTEEPSSSTDSSSSTATSSTPDPNNVKYMTRDGIPLKMPDPAMESKFLEQQHAIREEYQKANYSKALDLSKQLYQDMIGHYGTLYHPAVASTLNNIGLMHKSLGEWDAARANYEQSMTIYQKVVGTDHASYAATLHNVALLNKLQVQVEKTEGDALDVDDSDGAAKHDEELKDPPPIDPKTHKRHSELLDQAVEYLEKAWKIRKNELGEQHPKTVESRSSLGSTLAYKILYQHGYESAPTALAAITASTTTTTNDAEDGKKKRNSRVKKMKLQLWEVAEEHLREALKAAMANAARAQAQAAGSSPTTTTATPSSTPEDKADKPHVVVVTTTSSSTGSSSTSTASTSTSTSSSSSHSTTTNNNNTTASNQNADSRITTLAAASAAQNLAVCLKYRATNAAAVTSPLNPKKRQLLLHQARDLYQQALATRSALLGDEFHPHVIMSKHSLAECLDAMGEKLQANQLRMEMLDSYDRHVLKRKQEKEQAEKSGSSKNKK